MTARNSGRSAYCGTELGDEPANLRSYACEPGGGTGCCGAWQRVGEGDRGRGQMVGRCGPPGTRSGKRQPGSAPADGEPQTETVAAGGVRCGDDQSSDVVPGHRRPGRVRLSGRLTQLARPRCTWPGTRPACACSCAVSPWPVCRIT